MMYEQLAEKLEKTSSIRWHRGRGVKNEEWITTAESELGFSLPPSYLWWVREYGNAYLNGGWILTLDEPEHRDITDADLIYMHRLNLEDDFRKEHFPNRLDVYTPDSDEQYYFDLSSRDEQGEFPVMCHDMMNGIIDVYAPTFAAFLERLLDEHS